MVVRVILHNFNFKVGYYYKLLILLIYCNFKTIKYSYFLDNLCLDINLSELIITLVVHNNNDI